MKRACVVYAHAPTEVSDFAFWGFRSGRVCACACMEGLGLGLVLYGLREAGRFLGVRVSEEGRDGGK